MLLECAPEIVAPVVDRREAFACDVQDVLRSHYS